jgi:Transposase DDE domain
MGRRFRGPELVVPAVVAGWADPDIFRLMALADRVDVSGFTEGWRADGVGGVPYDPRLMLVTVWWCVHRQIRSPQQMARQCRESVSLRMVWQRERVPSAAALRRFVAGHPQGWQRVVVSLLAVCDQAGLVDVSVTATDSTPMAAPAALGKTLTAPRITVLIDQAEQELAALRTRIADLAEKDPAAFVASGPTLHRAEQLLLVRLARLHRAETRARERAADLAKPGGRDRRSRVLTWQSRVDKHTAELAAMTERQQQARDAYQAKVDAGRKPPGAAPHPPQDHPHIRQKTQALQRAQARLAAAQAAAGHYPSNTPAARANLTDPDSRILKGKNTTTWVLGALLTVTVAAGQLILAALLSPAGNDSPGLFPNLAATAANHHAAHITQPFGHHLADNGFASTTTFTTPPPGGGTLLIAVTNEHDQTRNRQPATIASHARQQMAARLATPEGHALYTRRSPMIEPVFAHLLRTDRRLHTRGHTSQHTEILALTTAYNAHKYLRHQHKPPTRTST